MARCLRHVCRQRPATLGFQRRKLSMEIFDKELKRRQRGVAAQLDSEKEYDYLRTEVARRLVDRIEDIQRDFPRALDIGCHTGHVYKAVVEQEGLSGKGGIGGIETLIQGDHSIECAQIAMKECKATGMEHRVESHTVVMDETFLPFQDESFDIVTSSLALQWVNDLPAALQEIKRVLKPDGVFIGAMMELCCEGGNTLTELRRSLLIAETEREGGVSQHISPSVSASDAGSLLTGAGFKLPTVDVDTIDIKYSDAFMLMEELQGMGENGALLSRRDRVSLDTFISAAALYQYHAMGIRDHGNTEALDTISADDIQPVTATFQVIYMIGWSPHTDQPMANKRGSATKSLKDIVTHSSGDSNA